MHIHIFKDLYSKKDMKLVFSPFISRGEILSYSRWFLLYHSSYT